MIIFGEFAFAVNQFTAGSSQVATLPPSDRILAIL